MPYIGNQPGTGVRSRFIYTATASQTTFSGADDNSKTLKYSDADYIDVYLNGVCLVPGTDYTASTKTSIVLTQAASLNDTLEVVAYDIATISDTVSKADGGTFNGDLGITNASPDITLTNNTSEDTDGGRESTLTFKGLQSGGEESTLAEIRASHDATADDQKGDLIFKTNDGSDGASPTEAMRIDSGQNVGIGDSNPQEKLTIKGDGARMTISSADQEVAMLGRRGSSGTALDDGYLRLRTQGSTNDGVVIDTNGDSHLNGGNVGIGDHDPFSKLHVEDTSWSSGSPYGTVLYVNGGDVIDNNWGHIVVTQTSTSTGSGGKLTFASNGDNPIAGIKGSYAGATYGHLDFYTRPSGGTNTLNMRITSGGFVGIGTDAPTKKLAVSTGGTMNAAARFDRSTDSSQRGLIEFLSASTGNTVGEIKITGTTAHYTSASDHRLKENVVDLTGATDRLKQLKPKRFNFIADADTTIDGFLAHEAQAVVPEAVSGKKDAMTEEVLYVDGDEIPEGKKVGDVKTASTIDPQGIDQAKLVPLLTAALQEAIAKIETLETKVAALEAG